ncbi:hypothetical protein G6N74_25615 [Mesorhizobium sp. CGMCC 1.15528]|uniref:Uncharacterized protein n=1 Tax=Mesorhizobium zhangyense TaxID=1776730 RepID=A0A7C9RE55_9HYPH|nr:hypothetical protein [Mesorhizobium zhangyense]NGN44453.1 hypothetical protein [Mesorhizobium zhangyense]
MLQWVAVDRQDLEELRTFDTLQIALISIGNFFLSGSLWIFAEQFFGREVFEWTPLSGFCVGAAMFGLVMIMAGCVLWRLRRRKVSNIFDGLGEI